MNARSYKTVFSKRLGALVAVGEHATSQGKANGASGPGASGAGEGAVSALAGIGYVAALSASFAFVSLAWADPATNALPTGGTVVQGAASMSQTANQLNIQQATQRAAINWQSFNIGAAATVNVAQPNAQAVLLNRVVGQSPSQIFGKLQANGHVILVNPNGVLFGKDGSVNAGGFTASTLNISDANFMAGNMVYERNGSTAGIVNQGSITAAPGGYVALLGATVSNEGSITTKGGSVVVGAGETIKVPVSGTGRIKLELTPAAINASVSNSGSIVTEGGQVYMQALALNRAAAQILQSGSIDTTGEKGGDVHVLADGGHIRVKGSVTANSTNGTAGGDIYIGRDKDTNVLAAVGDASGAKLESQGGFVETSGRFLDIKGTRVLAKDWLLDPFNVIIKSASPGTTFNATPGPEYNLSPTTDGSEFYVEDIVANLNANVRVTIQTTNTQPGGNPGTQAGNITVFDSIIKSEGNEATSLTLKAHNDIIIKEGVKIESTQGKLKVVLNSDSDANDSGAIIMRSGSKILTKGGSIVMGGGANAEGYAQGSGTQKYGVQLNNVTLDTTTTTTTTSSASEAGDITIRGRTTAAGGAGVYTTNAMVIKGKNISITGQADFNNASSNGQGIWFERNSVVSGDVGGTRITSVNGGNISLTGEIKGGVGNAVRVQGGNVGSAFLVNSAGSTTIKGTQSRNENNTSDTVLLSGTQIISEKTLSIEAKAANSNSRAIALVREAGGLNNSGWEETYGSNNGNLEIKANQGAIVMNSATATVLYGKNIIIDNTDSTFDGTGSVVNQGYGTSSLARVKQFWHGGADMDAAGININHSGLNLHSPNILSNSTAGLQVAAGGFITLVGSSSTGAGLNVRSNLTGSGNIKLVGSSTADGQAGVNLMGTVNNTSDGGSTKIIAKSGDVVFHNTAKVLHKESNTNGEVVVASKTGNVQVLGDANGRIQNKGKTYIYTGDTTGTGNLARLHNSLADLKLQYQGSGTINTKFRVDYGNGDHSNGLNTPTPVAQVLFRQINNLPQFLVSLADQTKVYGEADPTPNINDLSKVEGANKFRLVTTVEQLSLSREAGENVKNRGTDGYNYSLNNPNALNVGFASTTPSPKLLIKPRDVNVVIVANDKTYDGTTVATIKELALNAIDGNTASVVVAGDASEMFKATGLFDNKNVRRDANGNVISQNVSFEALATANEGVWGNYNITSSNLNVQAKITPKDAQVTANSATKNYTGQTQSVTGFTATGLVNGETESVLRDVATKPGTGVGKDLGEYDHVVAGKANNYNLTFVKGQLKIAPANSNSSVLPRPGPVPTFVDNNQKSSRVSTVAGFGTSGAATGVLDDKAVTESREVCSDVFPENCECQPSVIPSIEICFAPKSVAATKEEK